MKLSAFTVENYRSIRQSHRLVFGDSITTLIGPNNEGKSNIIRALISSLNGLSRYSLLNGRITQEGRARLSAPNIPSNRSPNRFYWERDFPISIQDEQPDAVTRFVLEFDPSLAERRRLQSLIGSAVQGSITFELKCGVSEWHLVVRDAAATSNILPKHIRSMCRIVSQAISPQYIPSVRTAESAQEIVRSIVRRELAALESKKEYRAAMKAISAIQKPALAQLSKSVTQTLKEFLPTVKRARLELTDEEREEAISQACSIIVNDGTETDLRQKGDGVQSLAAMSLARHAALLGAGRKRII